MRQFHPYWRVSLAGAVPTSDSDEARNCAAQRASVRRSADHDIQIAIIIDISDGKTPARSRYVKNASDSSYLGKPAVVVV